MKKQPLIIRKMIDRHMVNSKKFVYTCIRFSQINLCFIIFLFFISCTGNKESEEYDSKSITTISFDKAFPDKISLDDLIKTKKLIPLETTKESFIQGINKVIHNQDIFYVLDNVSQKLFFFQSNGKYIGQIGHSGRGNGEYMDIADFAIGNDHVYLLSTNEQCLFEYTLNGEFNRKIKIPFQAIGFTVLGTDQFAFYLTYDDEDHYNLKITDQEVNKIINEGFKFPDIKLKMSLYPITGHIVRNGQGVLYSEATSSKIFQITENGKIYPKYFIDFGSDYWQEENRYDLAGFFNQIGAGKLNYLTSMYREGSNTLLFTYNKKTGANSKSPVQYNNAYYFKNSGKLYIKDNFEDDLLYAITSSPVGIVPGVEEMNIAYITPINYLEKVRQNNDTPISLWLKQKLENIKEGDNPVLFLYQLNTINN